MINLEELLKIESSVENATCAILGESALAVPEFSDKKRKHPGYEVKVHGVGETGELYFIRAQIKYPQQWKAMLDILTVTQRFQNSDKQAAMLSAVRMMRFKYLALFERVLPFHYLTWMKEITTARSHIFDGKFDLTSQHFEIKVQIRTEFLPEEV